MAPGGVRLLVPCGPGTRPDWVSPPTSRPTATRLRGSREWASIASMALRYQPHPGTLLMCDFNTGFTPPEMTKRRPVVVISPRPKNQIGLCTVVPLSTAAPHPVKPFHHLMAARSLPAEFRARDSWAKCDMVYTVALRRLDWVSGRRALRVLDQDLAAIRRGVAVALGLDAGGGSGA